MPFSRRFFRRMENQYFLHGGRKNHLLAHPDGCQFTYKFRDIPTEHTCPMQNDNYSR
jgi:hypothetical protein